MIIYEDETKQAKGSFLEFLNKNRIYLKVIKTQDDYLAKLENYDNYPFHGYGSSVLTAINGLRFCMSNSTLNKRVFYFFNKRIKIPRFKEVTQEELDKEVVIEVW